jgi:uncharacterized protein (DUF433 family)
MPTRRRLAASSRRILESMGKATALLSTGIFDYGEAAHLLGVTDETVARIALPNASGEPAIVPATHSWAFSFVDLVALSVVVTLRRAHVEYPDIRAAKLHLTDDFQTTTPFAHKLTLQSLGFSDGDFVRYRNDEWERGADRQLVLEAPMAVYLRRLKFGVDDLAETWEPVDRVLLDPERQAGAPCIKFTRTETSVVAGLAKRGMSPARIASEFEVEIDGVQAAIEFERRVDHDGGLPGIAA